MLEEGDDVVTGEGNMSWDKQLEEVLGVNAGIELTLLELSLVDWVLTFGSHLLPDITWEDLHTWKELRHEVWRCIHKISQGAQENSTVSLYVDKDTCSVLLSVTPTTFKWSTGPDVGFSLKHKLFCYMEGIKWNDTNS